MTDCISDPHTLLLQQGGCVSTASEIYHLCWYTIKPELAPHPPPFNHQKLDTDFQLEKLFEGTDMIVCKL